MKHSMIECTKLDSGFNWHVIRRGEIIAKGINSSVDSARISAEKAILDKFKPKQFNIKVLMKTDKRQLYLTYSDL